MTTKTCANCHTEKSIENFSKDKNRFDRHYVYCKLCVKSFSRKRYLKSSEEINIRNKAWKTVNRERYLAQQREYSKAYTQTPNGKYRMYKAGATDRDLCFNLTMEQFMDLWQLPCTYCDSLIDTIGIDRVDNDLGYTVENIIPCCETCNIAKSTMTKNEYIDHCKKVANNNPI